MIEVRTSGLTDFTRFLQRAPEIATRAAAFAINDTARSERTAAKRRMQADAAAPLSTFEGRNFRIDRFASPGNLEAVIRAERRPLGLTTFLTSRTAKRKGAGRGLEVQIKRGGPKTVLEGSFLLPLRNGGRAVALRTKGAIRNSRAAQEIRPNLYLLSGPSVNQMFGVIAPERVKPGGDLLRRNFLRQFERLTRG